jgi:hypothetical protein
MMVVPMRTGLRPLSVLVALSIGAVGVAGGPLQLPRDEPPAALAALAALDPLDAALAVTLSDDSRLAAAALAHPERGRSSLVRITTETGVREVEVRGTVRALRFGPTSRMLFGVAYRDGKKGPQDTWLVSIDFESGRAERTVTLPDSARDLDLWVGGGALLVACQDEVRTVLLPQVRTGPLFWIVGDNLSVASLPGGDFVLVGQESQIVLVNLSDPQGREPLPVRERASISAAAQQLAASPDGTRALARLADGGTFEITLDPLHLERLDGTSNWVAWIGDGGAVPPRTIATPAAVAEPAEMEPAPVAERSEPAQVESEPVAEPEAKAAVSEEIPEPEPAAAIPQPPQGVPIETVAEPEAAAPTPEPDEGEAAPEPRELAPETVAEPEEVAQAEPAADPDLGELMGTVTGPAASEVVAVVLLGPDNIMREAKRVEPGADGEWLADGLAPGRYRVLLDGGGKRVLVSDPRFRQVRAVAGVRVRVEPLEALRTIER